MGQVIFWIGFIFFVIWMILDHRRGRKDKIEKAVEGLLKGKKAALSARLDPKVVFDFSHKKHDRFQREAEKRGFRKLGDIDSGTGKAPGISITRVMMDSNEISIMAFSIPNTQFAMDQIEMETWLKDGSFAYSTNNLSVYAMRQPVEIKLNPVKSDSMDAIIKSHKAFIEGFTALGFRKYDSIAAVASNMKAQGNLRKAVLLEKAFEVEENESREIIKAMGKKPNEKMLKKIYESARARLEIGKDEDASNPS